MLLNAGLVAASAGGGATINPEILWLEADYEVTESGGAVSAWLDRSTNAYSFTQGTAGSRPTLTAAAINGHPVLRFDGGDWLHMAATTLLNTSGATANIYVVSDHRGGTDGGLITTRSDTLARGFTVRYLNATTAQYFHTGFSPVLSRTIVDGYRLIEAQRNGLGASIGDSGTLPAATTLSGFTVESGGTWIGGGLGGGSSESNLNGDIAAIIIATSNRAGILEYLQDKYGV
jgi:hypothetical protein